MHPPPQHAVSPLPPRVAIDDSSLPAFLEHSSASVVASVGAASRTPESVGHVQAVGMVLESERGMGHRDIGLVEDGLALRNLVVVLEVDGPIEGCWFLLQLDFPFWNFWLITASFRSFGGLFRGLWGYM